jgi:2-keto-3-deoxy-L-rhamnonate aldolase RhmA
MSRMHDRLARGETAIGTLITTHGPELVEIVGYSGLDFACIDLMTTSLDWGDVATMVLAARRYDVTPWVRLPAYPWAGDDPDPGLAADVLRALAIGAECVMASVNTAEAVELLLRPAENAHRRFYILQGRARQTAEQARLDALEPEHRIFPCLESRSAIDAIDAILAVPGLRQIYLGMGDLTKALGHPGDDRHPEVRAVVAEVVAKAVAKGIVVSANTLGYLGPEADLGQRVAAGVRALADAGVGVVLIPRPAMVVQDFYERTLDLVRSPARPT